jgi:hypothetical protein
MKFLFFRYENKNVCQVKEGTKPVLLPSPAFSAMMTHYLFRNCITFP